jgi:plasmid stability protein
MCCERGIYLRDLGIAEERKILTLAVCAQNVPIPSVLKVAIVVRIDAIEGSSPNGDWL